MKNALVSILIPTFNRAHLISETLDSIIGQTYSNWECIIVDDGSSDNTQEIAENYSKKDLRFQFFKRPINKNKGVNSCRNIGLTKAQGEYIQWFDSDDIMHKDKLLTLVALIEVRKTKCVIGNFTYFRGKFNLLNDYKPFNIYNEKDLFDEYILGNTVLNFQSILWDRKLLEKDVLNESISYAEDVDFIFDQCMSNGFNCSVTDKVLVYIRKHEDTLTEGFKNRDIKSIHDEITVRQTIWVKSREFYANTNKQEIGFKMYLKSLKYLLYVKKYKTFFNRMLSSFYIVNVKMKFLILNLSMLAMFYIFTKSGITAYQKIINKL